MLHDPRPAFLNSVLASSVLTPIVLASIVLATPALVGCDPSDSLEAHAGVAPAGLPAAPSAPVELAAPLAPQAACGDDIDVDIRRSLAVTELEILTPFTFTRVMQQIVSTSQEPGITPTLLYQRWWDYFNEAPGFRPEAFHCDDRLVEGQPALGAFPLQCPRPEGVLAGTDPLSNPGSNPDAYVPIGLFNRFDLAPLDGSTCGEFRIIFAKRSGLTDPVDRNLIIFEAALPNPSPKCGVDGCRAIAQFWADLSTIDDPLEIRDRLEDFYFVDAGGAGPVVHADNYGPRGGQIRTNQFMNGPNIWQLHQFAFDHDCGFGPCIRPTTLKDTPFGELFQDPAPWKGANWFHTWFISQVANLSLNDVNGFFMRDAGTFKAGSSTSEGDADNYRLQAGGLTPFRVAVAAAITTPGLNADHIFNRALALSCAGCHQHSNSAENADLGGGLQWQPSLGFVHVGEDFTVEGPFGTRFPLSDALRFVFLPHRKQVLENFLAETSCAPCTQKTLDLFGTPSPKKFLPPGFSSTADMTLGGPRSGH